MSCTTKRNNVFILFNTVFLCVLLALTLVDSGYTEDSLLSAAQSGDAAAQYELAQRYTKNLQSQADVKNAYFWMKKAALQGLAKAQFFVGNMYCNGSGAEQSYIHGYVWHTLAAEGGISEAEEKLEILQEIMLTERDIQEALKIVAKLKEKIVKAP